MTGFGFPADRTTDGGVDFGIELEKEKGKKGKSKKETNKKSARKFPGSRQEGAKRTLSPCSSECCDLAASPRGSYWQ
jgi:hypothetical protein